MTGKIITPANAPLRGKANVPGDKSISHRMLIFAMLAEGTSLIRGLSNGDDVVRTRLAIGQLGAEVSMQDGSVSVKGGISRIKEPERPLDMGNSGTGLRLMAGVLARFDFLSVLIGDSSIHKRPMARIVNPLSQMGARIDGRNNATLAPLVIRGGNLKSIDYTPPVPSAQVKSSILLAAMEADGESRVFEKIATRRHTEELCETLGLPIRMESSGESLAVSISPCQIPPFDLEVAKDPSQAAFIAVAALLIEGSEVEIENVYLGPGRDGFIKVLQNMGANIEVNYHKDNTADILIKHGSLRGTVISGQLLADSIDEVPILAVAGAYAIGETKFVDAGELRAKESDRLEAIKNGLEALGVDVALDGDSLIIQGTNGKTPKNLVGDKMVEFQSYHDHRIAMAFSVATMAATNSTSGDKGVLLGGAPVDKQDGVSNVGIKAEIDDFDAVDTSWPGFLDDITRLQS